MNLLMPSLSADEVKKVYDRLLGVLSEQRALCSRVDSWIRPELAVGFELPAKASREHRVLQELSRTPWLRLVVDNVVQAMYVDSVMGCEGRSDAALDLWQGNHLSRAQVANHRSMIAYGSSFGVVTPGSDPRCPRIRFVSPKSMAVEYEYPGDESTMSATLESRGDGRFVLQIPGWSYQLRQGKRTGGAMDGLSVEGPVPVVGAAGSRVQLRVIPVVRFSNQMDLEGRVIGEVEPFIPLAQRVNKTSYDRLLAQHFNSWKVRTVTGLELPSQVDADGDPTDRVDEQAAERLKVKLAQDDILVGEDPETRFGTLDATALDPFVNSWRSDIEALGAASQTPVYALTGQMNNLTPDALAAARAPLTQKIYERQMNAGEAYAALLRVAGLMAGDELLAGDSRLKVTWQDMEIRSMSQAADALGKITQMLGVPRRALWGRIPGVEGTDVEQWERMADEEAERDPLVGLQRRHSESTAHDVTGGVDDSGVEAA